MKATKLLTGILLLLITSCQPQKDLKQVSISLDPSVVTGSIDKMVYGHFYEHIYHSANGGLWGDMIWNRSFEEYPSGGKWVSNNGILTQSNLSTDIKMFFGESSWTDYEFTLEAKKTDGYEAFLILFRASDEENFYWYNIGGWGNSKHALEKEVKDNRQVITDLKDCRIENNKWYDIKIRCKGNNIKGWLNGELLLDFTDEENPFLSGMIGLGSWSTEVNYRNIVVSSLNGKTLFKGLPDLPHTELLPRHWSKIGESKIIPVKSQALNSDYCVLFGKSEGDTRLHQDNISVEANTNYNGSIWIKGATTDKLVVSLKMGEEKLAENILTGFTSEWREYPIHFLPLKTSDEASIDLLASSGGHLYIDQFSLMSEKSTANDGFRPDLFAAVDGLKPPIIRWPGGCFAELYRWKDGIGAQHERGVFPITIWDDKDLNSLGTDEFITMCRKLDSEPLIVINAGFHEGAGTPEAWEPWIKEACEWLEYCNGPIDSKWGSKRAENGHPKPYNVKYWEIDNELWRSKVPDAKIYSEAVKLFSVALKEVDPSIIVIAHGGNGIDEKWNNILVKNSANYFDILSVHHYMDPDKFNEGVYQQEAFYNRTAKTMAESDNPNMKLYISEWNAQTTDWRTGLYAGGLLNAFERCGDFLTIGGPALFLRHVTANAWDNAFINFDHTGWFPAPNYVIMKLWRENYAPNRILSSCDDKDLNIVSTLSEDGNTAILKIVNPVEENKSIIINIPDAIKFEKPTLTLVAPDSLNQRNTMENPESIIPLAGKVKVSNQKVTFEIPPYSCGIIRITINRITE